VANDLLFGMLRTGVRKRAPALELSGIGVQLIQQTRNKTVNPGNLLQQLIVFNSPKRTGSLARFVGAMLMLFVSSLI